MIEACDRFGINPLSVADEPLLEAQVLLWNYKGASNEWAMQNREHLEVLQLLKRGREAQKLGCVTSLSWNYIAQV
jgi:hypothetical protein